MTHDSIALWRTMFCLALVCLCAALLVDGSGLRLFLAVIGGLLGLIVLIGSARAEASPDALEEGAFK